MVIAGSNLVRLQYYRRYNLSSIKRVVWKRQLFGNIEKKYYGLWL